MRRRLSKKYVESKRDELARVKADRDRYRLVIEGKETPFWREVEKRVDTRIKRVEMRLDEWAGMGDKELYAALEQRKVFRFFRDMVNESERTLEILDKRVERLESDIREAREGAIV